jgi:hypothetical protein
MRLLNMYDNESDVPGGCPSIGPPHIYIYIYVRYATAGYGNWNTREKKTTNEDAWLVVAEPQFLTFLHLLFRQCHVLINNQSPLSLSLFLSYCRQTG